ncbi:hypothetical protein L9F63_004869, partial [Diploptera punctata]
LSFLSLYQSPSLSTISHYAFHNRLQNPLLRVPAVKFVSATVNILLHVTSQEKIQNLGTRVHFLIIFAVLTSCEMHMRKMGLCCRRICILWSASFHGRNYYDDLAEDFRAVGRGFEACSSPTFRQRLRPASSRVVLRLEILSTTCSIYTCIRDVFSAR